VGTNNAFEIAVIGGGPSGIIASTYAAKNGRSVCLVDRKISPGFPVRCGEATSLDGFSGIAEFKDDWILSTITTMQIIAPSGKIVTVPNDYGAYIIDRKKMEDELTSDAIKAGVVFIPNTTITTITKESNVYKCSARDQSVTAQCVILAEGIESRLARQLGWSTYLAPKDVHSCAFARIDHPDVVKNTCVFYLGKQYAPAGYVWVFHRGKTSANVGLGTLGSYCKPGLPKELLMRFIDLKFPGANVSELHCGGVPMGKYISPLVKEGVLLAGDSARMVNCVNGAGISYSLFAGKNAGTVAASSFKNGRCDHSILKGYEKIWGKSFGKQQLRSYSIKEIMVGFTDKFLDDMAKAVTKSTNGKTSILKIFIRVFIRYPFHIFKVIKLLK